MTSEAIRSAARHQPWYGIQYVQVLIALALGILIGYLYPDLGKELKSLGDGFIVLIKMMIAPVIICTVVHGIPSMGDLKRIGRVGLKALIYFEVVSTVALIVGKLPQLGQGFNIDPASIDPKSVANYVTGANEEGIVAHRLGIIPDSYFSALARGNLLQALLVSIFPSLFSAKEASRFPMLSTRPQRCSSECSASSFSSRCSAPSAQWRLRWVPMASTRCGT